MLNSSYRSLGPVQLPYKGRQKYMHTFNVANPVMAEGYEDYLEPVTRLLAAAGVTEGEAHMTVDEKVVRAGASQRRPKPHVDGHFYPELQAWGGGGGGWNHYCNGLPLKRMSVIVAASAVGCRAWEGSYDATPTECGDLSHISEQLGEGRVLEADVGWQLSPDCVHESMLMEQDTQRTFLRIALPVQ